MRHSYEKKSQSDFFYYMAGARGKRPSLQAKKVVAPPPELLHSAHVTIHSFHRSTRPGSISKHADSAGLQEKGRGRYNYILACSALVFQRIARVCGKLQ